MVNYMEKCKSGCSTCIRSYTGYEWRVLLSSYLVFYLFLTGWFALHLTVMVNYLPEDVSTSQPSSGQSLGNGIVNNGEFFSIREARFPRYQTEGIALARRATGSGGNMVSVPPYPWRECGQAPGADCQCSGGGDDLEECSQENTKFTSTQTNSSMIQQVRLMTSYSSRRIGAAPLRIKCSPSGGEPPRIFGVFDPYQLDRTRAPQQLFTTPAPVAGVGAFFDYTTAVSSNGRELDITFTEGAEAPYIVQFQVTPESTLCTPDRTTVGIRCAVVSEGGFDFEDDSGEASFSFTWANGWC